jgi:hypothetical protein
MIGQADVYKKMIPYNMKKKTNKKLKQYIGVKSLKKYTNPGKENGGA